MGGSKKPPKQSDAAKANEELSTKLMEEQLKQAKTPLDIPNIAPPKPIPPPAPPAMSSSADVAQAQDSARQAALKRTNSGRGTLFAGETGGYKPGALGGAKTLLG